MIILPKKTWEGSSSQNNGSFYYALDDSIPSCTLSARLLFKVEVQGDIPHKPYTLSYKNPWCFWRPNSTQISTCKVAKRPVNLSRVRFQAHETDKPNLGSASTYHCWRPRSLHVLHFTPTPVSAPHKFCITAGTACQNNMDPAIWEILK